MLLIIFIMHFSMMDTRGSGSDDTERPSASDDEIRRIFAAMVEVEIR